MSERIDHLTGRVTRLEEDVSDLKVSTARISTQIAALTEQNRSQFLTLSTSLNIIDKRVCTATGQSKEDEGKVKKIIHDLLTPQTIAIILAILASALGAPMVSQSIMSSQVSSPVGTQVPASATETENE